MISFGPTLRYEKRYAMLCHDFDHMSSENYEIWKEKFPLFGHESHNLTSTPIAPIADVPYLSRKQASNWDILRIRKQEPWAEFATGIRS